MQLAPTTIVVPCYNEAKRLQQDAFVQAVEDASWLRFLFVDDGSGDDTASVLAELVARRPDRLSLLRLAQNGGKAEAVRQGVLATLSSSAEVVGFWDADLATPLSEIPPMCALLLEREAQLVLASRIKLLGRHIDRNPVRHYIGRVCATAASLVLDLPVYDTQCGAKIFRRGPLLDEIFSEPFSSRWLFDVELLARMLLYEQQHGLGVVADGVIEYPVQAWIDVRGSKVRATDYLRAGVDLARIGWRLHAGRRRGA